MSAPFRQVLDILDSHGYDIDSLSPLELGKLIYDITQNQDIQLAQFKDNRTSTYRLRGYKVTDAINRYTDDNNCEIYLIYINLGNMPLRDENTVKLARLLTEKAVPSDVPQRHKIERGETRNSLIHVHSIFPSTEKPPEYVRHRGKRYKVNAVILGQDPRYTGTRKQQLIKAVKYFYKPSNMTGTENHKKLDLKHLAYYEWFRDKLELLKLTARQIKKLKGVKLSWNKNIK